jgi:hypothetical protein
MPTCIKIDSDGRCDMAKKVFEDEAKKEKKDQPFRHLDVD